MVYKSNVNIKTVFKILVILCLTSLLCVSMASATGLNKTVTYDARYTIITWTYDSTPGTDTWNVPSDTLFIDYLVVAGGGAGGSSGGGAGGGGAGGLLYDENVPVSHEDMTITVGAGGIKDPISGKRGGNGGNSSLVNGGLSSNVVACGGGGGGGHEGVDTGSGQDGGSGGGEGTTGATPGDGIVGQGYGGGNYMATGNRAGGGGGGASEVGEDAISGAAGDGGDGSAFDITGTMIYYAGGGGGSADNSGTGGTGGLGGGGNGNSEGLGPGTAGTDGLGGGGGGGNIGGYDGGSGVVIIRYSSLSSLFYADYTIESPLHTYDYYSNTPIYFNSTLSSSYANETVHDDCTYYWDFDDGTTSTLENPSHSFTNSGNYNVSLKTTYSLNTSINDTASHSITIYPSSSIIDKNNPPNSTALDDSAYGFRWLTGSDSPTLVYVDENGIDIEKPEFDNSTLFGNIWRCGVYENGTIIYGDNARGDGLDLNGPDYDIMVHIPLCWYKTEQTGFNLTYWVSPVNKSGYEIFEDFYMRGHILRGAVYIGAYESCGLLDGADFKMHSWSGFTPVTGGVSYPYLPNTGRLNIDDAEDYSNNKGDYWGEENIYTHGLLSTLIKMDLGSLNSQSTLGRGIVDKAIGSGFAGESTGADNADTNISTNGTGSGDGVDGYTPVVWRGIENPWGNVNSFIVGYNAVDSEYRLSGYNDTTIPSILTSDYTSSTATPITTDGYSSAIVFEDTFDYLFLSSTTGGSSSTYLTDYWSAHDTGETNIFASSGTWYNDDDAGINYVYSSATNTATYAAHGARLEYLPLSDSGNATESIEAGITITSPASIYQYFTNNTFTFNSYATTVYTPETLRDSATWNWSFGDGYYSSSENPTHSYTTNGTYNISVTITSNTASDTAYTEIDVVKLYPKITITEPELPINYLVASNISFNSSTSLYAPTTLNSTAVFNWSFGDTGTSTERNPTHLYMSSGDKTVTLTILSNGYTNTTTKIITIVPPTVDFHTDDDTTGVQPLEVSFIDDTTTSNITSWTWSFGDSVTSTEQNPTHEYDGLATGYYTVSLNVSIGDIYIVKTKENYIHLLSSGIYTFPEHYYTPTDIDHDFKYMDCNGNGVIDVEDAELHWYYMEWMGDVGQDVYAFDYNGNGIIDYRDSILIYNNLT